MPHLHTEPGQHDHTASAFIMRTDTPEPTILFHLHKKVGKLLQPGGHVELHETPWQAVCHEISEETGYGLSQLQVLQPRVRIDELRGATLHPMPLCQNTHRFSSNMEHFHTDTCYALLASGSPIGRPDDGGESHDLRWLTLEQLQAFSDDEIVDNSRQVAIFALEHALDDWVPTPLHHFAT